MPYQRGNIIEIAFDLPYDGSSPTHPFVIISNDDVYEYDGMYVCVMLTHMKKIDLYTFEITEDMLLKKGDGKFSQARCHIIANVRDEDIIPNNQRNSLKLNAVSRIIAHVNATTFG